MLFSMNAAYYTGMGPCSTDQLPCPEEYIETQVRQTYVLLDLPAKTEVKPIFVKSRVPMKGKREMTVTGTLAVEEEGRPRG